jgi:hypothetical protein
MYLIYPRDAEATPHAIEYCRGGSLSISRRLKALLSQMAGELRATSVLTRIPGED